jgi:hypothetical protein
VQLQDESASTHDSNHDTCVHVDALVQGRLMPSSIAFLKSLPNIGEFEQQGSAAPSLNLQVMPEIEKQCGAGVLLKHEEACESTVQAACGSLH